jgi:hypothetical protein
VAKLKAARRKKLPKTAFALPGKRAYPVHDRAHAANAKARAKQQLKKGRISKSTYSRIVAKANKKLRKKR